MTPEGGAQPVDRVRIEPRGRLDPGKAISGGNRDTGQRRKLMGIDPSLSQELVYTQCHHDLQSSVVVHRSRYCHLW